ncbi:MAG: biotin/lipoate A/B protein ligase family protein [Propionibacteriaceae bacterium]|nr:biotin/lipoate A/B protein ligase family protein [Propionibacteriaceae bacterium]
MRGEYKVPGGKLVAVDIETDGERISHVAVSGDFFLEPDEALFDINAALLGLPSTSTVAELAAAIESRLAPETQMIGFTPEAVGIAVRRALGHATDWSDHTFDVIGPVSMDPRMHVALDEVIAAELARGEVNPSLRIWEWDQPLVVIGSFQSYRNEIDDEGRERHGINVVRRITGGGAMFMEPGNCVTYSLVVPVSLVEGLSFERSYEFLDQWVMGALKELGVNARYIPLNDIASDKGKIAGAAQRRVTGGVVVHHVTMAYDIDADKMLEVLRIGREKMSDKGTKSANKRVDPLRSQTQRPRDEIIASFLQHFEGLYDTQRREYTDEELAQAQQLVETKFSSEEWTKRIP